MKLEPQDLRTILTMVFTKFEEQTRMKHRHCSRTNFFGWWWLVIIGILLIIMFAFLKTGIVSSSLDWLTIVEFVIGIVIFLVGVGFLCYELVKKYIIRKVNDLKLYALHQIEHQEIINTKQALQWFSWLKKQNKYAVVEYSIGSENYKIVLNDIKQIQTLLEQYNNLMHK